MFYKHGIGSLVVLLSLFLIFTSAEAFKGNNEVFGDISGEWDMAIGLSQCKWDSGEDFYNISENHSMFTTFKSYSSQGDEYYLCVEKPCNQKASIGEVILGPHSDSQVVSYNLNDTSFMSIDDEGGKSSGWIRLIEDEEGNIRMSSNTGVCSIPIVQGYDGAVTCRVELSGHLLNQ